MKVTETSFQEIKLDFGKLYVTESGRRYKLATCKPTIAVYESEHPMTFKGSGTKFTVKTCSAILALCDEVELTRDVDVDFFGRVSNFELYVQHLLPNGQLKDIRFDSIIPKSISINGEWTFDITAYLDEVKELFPNLILN